MGLFCGYFPGYLLNKEKLLLFSGKWNSEMNCTNVPNLKPLVCHAFFSPLQENLQNTKKRIQYDGLR